MDFHWLDKSPGAPSAFPNLEMKAEFFKPISPAVVPSSCWLTGGTTMGYEQTGIPQYFLGGVPGLLAYGTNEVRGDQYFLFRPGYMHRLFSLPPFVGSGFYAVTLYEIGKMYNAPGVSKLPNDGAAGSSSARLLGPYSLAEASETPDMPRGSSLWATSSSPSVHAIVLRNMGRERPGGRRCIRST